MNALLDAAIDHPLFWPLFVLAWFLASAAVGPLLSILGKRSRQ